MRAELQPVGSALLDEARRRAQLTVAQASSHAAEVVVRARADAASLVAAAQEEGESDGDAAVREEVRAARHDATAIVLGARREMYEELCRLVEGAVTGLRRDPGYAAIVSRLRALVLARLGAGADLELDVSGAGGVVGRLGTRRVDCTLPALAHRLVELHAGDVEEALTGGRPPATGARPASGRGSTP